MGIAPIMTAQQSLTLDGVDSKEWLHYLEQICEVFRGEIPHVKHQKLDFAEFKQKTQSNTTMADFTRMHRLAAAKRAEDALKKAEDVGTSHPAPSRRAVRKISAEQLPSKIIFKFTLNNCHILMKSISACLSFRCCYASFC